MKNTIRTTAEYQCSSLTNREVLFEISGSWKSKESRSVFSAFLNFLDTHPETDSIVVGAQKLQDWDSGLLSFLLKLKTICDQRSIELNLSGLPQGLQKLLDLATAVPERKGAARAAVHLPFLVMLGEESLKLARETKTIISFVGDAVLVFLSFLKGKTSMRKGDLFLIIEESGPRALPIVTLISLLVGLILAFIGAVQLAQFGAQLYVANLVGIAMLREMGPVMAGIIVAGRTGAAFAAELGTMQVNEEIDALQTSGIDPLQFLVLPRMLALMTMLPLLCLYADFMGILGGALVSITALDISSALYWEQTWSAIRLSDFLLGLGKSVAFGILVALSGCLRGMQSGRDSAAVGKAATSAVVTSIVLIVITDALFALGANIVKV